jgi:hypothetical protein
MIQTKIDLLEPFERVLAAVLSAPERHEVIGNSAAQNAAGAIFAKGVNAGPASDAELRKVLRCLYEAAHGRQVETQIGLIAIAPPVAPFLKERPFYIKTQVEFFLEALTRIISGASHSNSGIPPPQTFAKKQVEKSVLNDVPRIKRTKEDASIDMRSNGFLRPKRPVFLG